MRFIAALAMKQVLVEEPNRLNTELLSVELSICSYINILCVFIYLISCLACLVRHDLSIFWAAIYIIIIVIVIVMKLYNN